MLFAHHVDDEDDEEFVLVLPPGSVRSYFKREGRGMALVVEPGLLSSSGEFDRVQGDVRTAVLTEAGRVLNVRPTDVLSQPFDHLKSIAERDGFQKTPWDSRKRTRGRSGGSSRKGATLMPHPSKKTHPKAAEGRLEGILRITDEQILGGPGADSPRLQKGVPWHGRHMASWQHR